MHQQIRTSPPGASLMDRLEVLRSVNIEGVGPELEPDVEAAEPMNHLRFAFRHPEIDAAEAALDRAHYHPQRVAAIVVALENEAGGLLGAIERLAAKGKTVESVLVLASRDGDKVLVSIGLAGDVLTRDEWDLLGGWDEDSEKPPEELSAS